MSQSDIVKINTASSGTTFWGNFHPATMAEVVGLVHCLVCSLTRLMSCFQGRGMISIMRLSTPKGFRVDPHDSRFG